MATSNEPDPVASGNASELAPSTAPTPEQAPTAAQVYPSAVQTTPHGGNGEHVTYEPNRPSGEPANIWMRLSARVVDLILVVAADYAFTQIILLLLITDSSLFTSVDTGGGATNYTTPYWMIAIAALLSLIVRFINDVVLVVAFGGTIGKLIFQMRVVNDQTKERLRYAAAVVRFIMVYWPNLIVIIAAVLALSVGSAISGILVYGWYVVLLGSILINPQLRRGIHDRVARSLVVYK